MMELMNQNMIDDNKLCYEFQKRYAALHPNDTNTHHNLYICKSVDKDGNITDIKYGMNTLTDWGLYVILTANTYKFNTGNGTRTINIDDHSQNSSNKSKLDGCDYPTYRYVVMGTGTDPNWPNYPDPATETFDNMFGIKSSFNIQNAYNAYNDEGYQDFTNNIITCTVKLIYGYYDYQVYQNDGTIYTENVNLERLGIINYYSNDDNQLLTLSYIYDSEGRKSHIVKKPNEKLYITIYATMVVDPAIHDRLYSKNVYAAFSAVSLLKFIAHHDYSGHTQNSLENIIANLGNNRGWYEHGYNSTDELTYQIFGAYNNRNQSVGQLLDAHWQSLGDDNTQPRYEETNWDDLTVDQRLQHWYGTDGTNGKTDAQKQCWSNYASMPSNMSDMDVSKSIYPYLLDEHIVYRTTGNTDITNISKLIEKDTDYISHVTYTDMYIFNYSTSPFYTFHLMLWLYPELQEPEMLTTDLMWTDSPYSVNFDNSHFGRYLDIDTGAGVFPVANFTMQSLKRYNYMTHSWDIDIPFVADGSSNMYDMYHFNNAVGINIMIGGVPTNVLVYINCGKHTINGATYPGFKDIQSFDNSEIITIYGTDKYWDPASWVICHRQNLESDLVVTGSRLLIPTINGQPNPLIGQTVNLQHKKYYVMTNPTHNISSNSSYYEYVYGYHFALNPSFSNVSFDHITNDTNTGYTTDNKFITELPGDSDSLSPLVFTGRAVEYAGNRYDLDVTQKAFCLLCNDDTSNGSPRWSSFARCVVYYDNDLNPTVVYPLTCSFRNTMKDVYPSTSSDNSEVLSGNSRWKYKNRILIGQYGCMGQMIVYDFNDSSITPPSWQLEMHNHAKYFTHDTHDYNGCIMHHCLHNDNRYVTHFCYDSSTGGKYSSMKFYNPYDVSYIIDIGDPDDENTLLRDPTFYTFPETQFISPIINTSLMIARFGTPNDGCKTVTIFDMRKYTEKIANGETHEDALSDEDVIKAIIEIPMESSKTDEPPIICATGFNDHVYIRFHDGVAAYIWHYNIQSHTLETLLNIDQRFKDYFGFGYYYAGPFNMEYGSGNHCGWIAKYHTCSSNDVVGNGIFIISLVSLEYSPYSETSSSNYNNMAYVGHCLWVIKESDPTNLERISLSKYINKSVSLLNSGFDITMINDKELILYTKYQEQYMYDNYERYTPIVCWDLGLWLDNPTNTLENRVAYNRDEQCAISNCDAYPRITGNAVMGNYMLIANEQKNRIEFIPLHKFLNFKCTGTTTTVQSYNNPKRLSIKHPFTMVWSNRGLKYKSNWMGVPDYDTIYLKYNLGQWDKPKLRTFVLIKALTKEQFKTITGEDYD